MTDAPEPPLKLVCRPVTPDHWRDLAALFGARGACGGCWCMCWRLPARDYEAGKGAPNRRALRAQVERGEVPGLLGYADAEPVGWVSVAPRAEFVRLARSRVLSPVDDLPVWSISCLFVAKPYRRRGASVALLRAAADYAHERGAPAVEGYPYEPRQRQPDPFVWTGLASAFRTAGFTEVARRSPTRPIMRRVFEARQP